MEVDSVIRGDSLFMVIKRCMRMTSCDLWKSIYTFADYTCMIFNVVTVCLGIDSNGRRKTRFDSGRYWCAD